MEIRGTQSMAKNSKPSFSGGQLAGPARDLGEEAYNSLKAAIANGTIHAGQRLTEADAAARLAMSRTPIREAIHRLETEGLLTRESRRGLVVTQPDHQMMIELYVMRETLEATAAKLAAQHASDIEIATLRALIEHEPNLHDPQELYALNKRIHNLIYSSAHNRYLLRSLTSMSDTMALLPTMLGDPERAKEAHEEHLVLLAAIEARNSEAAEAAARRHLQAAQRKRLKWMVENFSSQ
jgi:DNA-binding GntR family transcriptional regulator